MLIQTGGGKLKLKEALLRETAALFSVTQRTIRRVWERAQECISNGSTPNVCSRLPKRAGRKRIQVDINRVGEIPLRRRTNIRSLSNAINVPKSTLYRRIKEGAIRPHSNALKPYLSEENKKVRLQFCLSMLEPNSLEGQPVFKDMHNYVHIDEKWFYMSKESERYYLLPEENEPLRTCKSKKHIAKVMFLAAVARPRFDSNGNEEFSGKIGIFPFVYTEPAKRRSKNRAAGTLETKAISSVTKDVIRSCLIEKVLPSIQTKWPGSVGEPIYIQQDNARPHIHPMDPKFLEAACKNGFDIRLTFQPPNSPDMNVLDLGFFRAIQSLQYQEAPSTVDELVNAVQKSFEELPSKNLNYIFLSLQTCLVEVMKVNGGNNYKLPHIGKQQLMRIGDLPSQIQCERDVVEKALAYLQQ